MGEGTAPVEERLTKRESERFLLKQSWGGVGNRVESNGSL